MPSEWTATFPDALFDAFAADDPTADAKVLERKRAEVVRRLFHAAGAGDAATLLPDLDPDIEMEIHCPVEFPFKRRAKGARQVADAVVANFASLEKQQPTIVRVVAQGDLIDVLLRETGRVKDAASDYQMVGFQQFVFRGDKVVRFVEALAHQSPA